MAIVKLAKPFKAQPQFNIASRDPEAILAGLSSAGLNADRLDVVEAARMLGLDVRREPMDDDMSGYLERRGSQWVIGVNAHHHPARQRFTIAHELAHFVLHRNDQSRFDDRTFARRANDPSMMEREADSFAASLLMPESAVRRYINSGVKGLNELAGIFGVSTLAMKYRLRNLDYSLT